MQIQNGKYEVFQQRQKPMSDFFKGKKVNTIADIELYPRKLQKRL